MKQRNQKRLSFKFRLACWKVMHARWKLLRHHLKTLKFCLYRAHKIYTPHSKGDELFLGCLLEVYDETIADLNKQVELYRNNYKRYEELFGGQ